MAKRKAISKRVRFEVFKRDSFKCQYCGHGTPDVILHVDHIVAVAAGGSNDIDNLLTSCEACNLGKSDKPLTAVPQSMLMEQAELRERREQMKAFAKWKDEVRESKYEGIRRLGVYWYDFMLPQDSRGLYRFHPRREASIKTFLRNGLTEDQIQEAMDIAQVKLEPDFDDDDDAFRYFCGVCWGMIREASNEA